MARNQLATHTITRLQDKCMSLEIEISNLRNEVQVLRNGAMALLTENADLRRDVQRLRAELPTPQTVRIIAISYFSASDKCRCKRRII